MNKHTLTPWKTMQCKNLDSPDSIDIIFGEECGSSFICDCGDLKNDNAQANAAFIVTACNSYEADQKKIAELVAVVRLMRREMETFNKKNKSIAVTLWDVLIDKADNALAE